MVPPLESPPPDHRPVIGIVGHGYTVPKPFGALAVHGTPQWYATAVTAVGGRPVIVPPGAGADLLDVLDGLVLTGGGDVDPARYGGPPGTSYDVDAERDANEIELVLAAARLRVPLLGVCRGLQVLAVTFGGTLRAGVEHVRPEDGHVVMTAEGSLIRSLLGPHPRTSALHRQAVDDAGPHWTPTAWCGDGVVEAIEPRTTDWPVLAVQWHPELAWNEWPHDSTGPSVFGWLVATAGRRPHALTGKHSPRTAVAS